MIWFRDLSVEVNLSQQTHNCDRWAERGLHALKRGRNHLQLGQSLQRAPCSVACMATWQWCTSRIVTELYARCLQIDWAWVGNGKGSPLFIIKGWSSRCSAVEYSSRYKCDTSVRSNEGADRPKAGCLEAQSRLWLYRKFIQGELDLKWFRKFVSRYHVPQEYGKTSWVTGAEILKNMLFSNSSRTLCARHREIKWDTLCKDNFGKYMLCLRQTEAQRNPTYNWTTEIITATR